MEVGTDLGMARIAAGHSHMGMDMDMELGHGQMRLHKSRKALAAAGVVMLRVAPCKTIVRNCTVNRSVRRMVATSRLAATIWTERGWLFCIAKYAAMTSASAISVPVNYRSIWS